MAGCRSATRSTRRVALYRFVLRGLRHGCGFGSTTLLGQWVRTLVDDRVAPGLYEVRWDGRDEAGVPVASGAYLSRLQVGQRTDVRRMLLLR